MGINELIWALKSKGFDARIISDLGGEIVIILKKEELRGWVDVLKRLNAVYQNLFVYTIENEYIKLIFTDTSDKEKVFAILKEVILKEEYRIFSPKSRKKLDFKLGYSCNNNCIHCCIKPELWRIKSEDPSAVIFDSGFGMQCHRDLTFAQIIEKLTVPSIDYEWITLTGGEPTNRPDFIAIVKWLYYNRPNTGLCLQTNGRNLADENLVRLLRRYTRKVSFTIAIHGLEQTHNTIVNNRKETGNPFQETICGIRNIHKYFGNDPYLIRTETVISKLNVSELLDCAEFLHEQLGICSLGLSYPHLCNFSLQQVDALIPQMDVLLESLRSLNAYNRQNPDVRIIIEQVPYCIFSQIEPPVKLLRFKDVGEEDVEIIALDNKVTTGVYNGSWSRGLGKPETCNECLLNDRCYGIYVESLQGNGRFLMPIPKERTDMFEFIKNNCC